MSVGDWGEGEGGRGRRRREGGRDGCVYIIETRLSRRECECWDWGEGEGGEGGRGRREGGMAVYTS